MCFQIFCNLLNCLEMFRSGFPFAPDEFPYAIVRRLERFADPVAVFLRELRAVRHTMLIWSLSDSCPLLRQICKVFQHPRYAPFRFREASQLQVGPAIMPHHIPEASKTVGSRFPT